jgi:small subunit ribosomal protein S19
MARSLYKGPFVDPFILKKLKDKKLDDDSLLWSRRSVITPQNVGHKWQIHNGKGFLSFRITESMVGHKFGEFALTRKKGASKKKKKR